MTKLTKTEIARIYREAVAAGKAAGNAATPTPMVVRQHASPLDDASPVTRAWHVPEGVCGFAWVTVGGNTQMGRYMRTVKGHGPGYPKGVAYRVGDHGQSLTRKEAHAYAFARVLNDAGITAYVESRMD